MNSMHSTPVTHPCAISQCWRATSPALIMCPLQTSRTSANTTKQQCRTLSSLEDLSQLLTRQCSLKVTLVLRLIATPAPPCLLQSPTKTVVTRTKHQMHRSTQSHLTIRVSHTTPQQHTPPALLLHKWQHCLMATTVMAHNVAMSHQPQLEARHSSTAA